METENKEARKTGKVSFVFFENILLAIMRMVPKVKRGAIVMFDGQEMNVVTAIGYNVAFIKKYLNMKPLPQSILRIDENLLVPLRCDGLLQGIMILGASLNEEYTFNEMDIQIIRNFVKFVEYFYNARGAKDGFENTAYVLVKMLEYHDTNIKGHSERVAWLSMKTAEFMRMDKENICKIYWAGYLHDVGKIFVPQSILNKQNKLSYEEYEVVKEHPVKSAEILTEIFCPGEIIEIVKYHHERWDGRGYPEGLRNFDIPLGSRIVAVADAYDAMISPRSYRKPLSVEKAIEELKSNSNSQFDPNIVEIFLRIVTYDRIPMPYNFGSMSLYQETSMTK